MVRGICYIYIGIDTLNTQENVNQVLVQLSLVIGEISGDFGIHFRLFLHFHWIFFNKYGFWQKQWFWKEKKNLSVVYWVIYLDIVFLEEPVTQMKNP